MSNQSRGRKISDFNAQTALPSGSFLTYIYNGQNYKILDSDFYSSLGVTGTIEQAGDPSGIPVLNISGTVNQIRNIEPGAGIFSEVSAQGGVTIKTNFDQDATGQPVVDDVDAEKPTFASFVPGTGIEISKAADVITITATGALPATKTVTVNQEGDFPAAVSGVITLEPSTTYVISNDVTTANRFVMQANTSVTGSSTIGPLLTYTGVGTMFTAQDATALVQNLHYSCPNGKAFDASDVVSPNTSIFSIINAQCEEAVDFGDFTSLFALNVFNSNCLSSTGTGPKFFGSGWGLISMDRFALITANGAYVGIDLGTCVSDGIEFNDLLINGPSGAVAVTGAASSANLTSGSFGTITNCNFGGAITPIAGIDPTSDIRWQSTGNDGIADSRTDALMSIQGNALETIIAAAGTPVKMNGVWTDEGSALFTTDATGRMTYIGERDARLPIDATLTLLTASGGSKQVSAYIAINGAVVSATKKTGTATSSNAASITMIWQRNFAPGDYVELFLANEDDAVNLVGSGGVGRIN